MKYITAIKLLNSTFGLPCYLRKENSAIPHSSLMQLDTCKKFQINLSLFATWLEEIQ